MKHEKDLISASNLCFVGETIIGSQSEITFIHYRISMYVGQEIMNTKEFTRDISLQRRLTFVE